MPQAVTLKTYGARAVLHPNPTAKRLLEIMERKKTNLCVSIDVTTTKEVLEIVRRVGSSICMIKVRLAHLRDGCAPLQPTTKCHCSS